MHTITSRDLILCNTPNGPFLVFPEDAIIGRSITSTGGFGENKIVEVLDFLETHFGLALRNFIDIGANIGTHVLFAMSTGKIDHAIAVEADPNNYMLLAANVAMRGFSDRVKLFNCALSNQTGSVELELCSTNYGDHRVRVAEVTQDRDFGESIREVRKIPANTADHLFAADHDCLTRALVWMDTQGHEGHIISGASETLRKLSPAVVMEFWPYGLHRADGKKEYFEFLQESHAIYDLNRADWINSGLVNMAELEDIYEKMLSETREGYYPHTDLLCIRRVAPQQKNTFQNSECDQTMNALERSLMTISCRDSDVVPKVPDAGKVVYRGSDKVQIMHNGVEVVYGGYHGDWMAHVIRGLNGHHEPQEELVFHILLRYIRNRTQIVELGCFWAYYTMWYLKEIPDSIALCVEPDAKNIEVGKRNAILNACSERVRFMSAWVGAENLASYAAPTETSPTPRDLPMLNAMSVCDHAGDAGIELLHMDTQGAELGFLKSIDPATARDRFRFIMVSTHHSSISGSTTTHCDCLEALRALGASVLVEHDVIESFSGDGLILASMRPEDRNLWFPPLSRNRAETSLFKRA